MSTLTFPARLDWNDDDRAFHVVFPDVPEAITAGATREEALANAEDALEEAIAAYINLGRDLPVPGAPAPDMAPVSMGPLMAAKAALYDAWRRAGLSKIALAERLGVAENAVRRMLDPRHPTKIESLDEALRALGRRLIVSDEELRVA